MVRIHKSRISRAILIFYKFFWEEERFLLTTHQMMSNMNLKPNPQNLKSIISYFDIRIAVMEKGGEEWT